MNKPRHRYTDMWFQFGDAVKVEKHDVRWTRTSGEEWDALMERARAATLHITDSMAAYNAQCALRDIIAYMEDQK